ncbi:MAG TPA: PEP/pyruvate-binding domain-containing protein [Myxococcota bacterium]|nr:PEP/pyruvate-binding domain-containing protein [Myxococcota bacterium]
MILWALVSCNGEMPDEGWECIHSGDERPAFLQQLGCEADFDALAAAPLDASIPGARSTKTVVDRADDDSLYFQDSERYQIHWEFAFEHLSGDGLPIVDELGAFNETEYTSPERRFVLGALTIYEEPNVWAWEVSPYDTATADMITLAYRKIRDNSWIGEELYFHPTSESVAEVAEDLPSDVKVITTEELFAGITYQPLNLGTSMGKLRFYEDPEEEIPNFREIVVLPAVPNDMPVVMGIVTDAFQTPLAHINVLSQNRGTPNMALIGAWQHPELRALEDLWVELTVEAHDWSVREVTQEEADAWWEGFRPEPLDVTSMDLSIQEILPIEEVVDLELGLVPALDAAVPAFGGKASHFAVMSHSPDAIPMPTASAMPVYFYDRFMEENGFWDEVDEMMADPDFTGDALTRDGRLRRLRSDMRRAPIDEEFLAELEAYVRENHSGHRVRFRSSTNAEDVSGFNGAGLYTSQSGDPDDPERPIEDALREVWASCWSFRAYEERSYYGIDHTDIGMAVLMHRSFPSEDANGVAITANIFDTSGLEPAFYVNVQYGDNSVVLPDEGVTTDRYLHYFDNVGQPVVYLGHSNLVPDGENVLTETQIKELSFGLDAIHDVFYDAYGHESFYGMDVEFKFDQGDLYIKQARPYPGRGE